MATRTAIRHGEILLLPVDCLPKNFVEVEKVTSCIVGHSESGHHHVLECDAVFEQIRGIPRRLFVDLPCDARLRHLKSYQPHRELRVPAGRWQVICKTEFDVSSTVAPRRAVCD
jgi:hypothetical protein